MCYEKIGILCSASRSQQRFKMSMNVYPHDILKTKLMTDNTSCINTDQSKWTEAWDCHKLQVPGLSYNWWGFQARDILQDSTDNSSIDKVETSLEWQEYFSLFQDTTDVLPCHIHLHVVNHGPLQQNSKEKYKPWKWGVTTRYYASHTKTMLQTRKSMPRSSRQSEYTKAFWPL